MKLIKLERSLIPSCDVPTLEDFEKLVSSTCSIEGVGAYKIGFELALSYGLQAIVKSARKYTKLPIIYDHQKAGTDVPFTGEKFARVCKNSGIDSVILFPQAGPATEEAWINACKKEGLHVIVGGEMTHPKYVETDGGFLTAKGIECMYLTAAKLGITDFVVPGNKPERIKYYRELLKDTDPIFYSPGLISQGGDLTESAHAAGNKWHAIIGRALYQSKDITAKAKELASSL